MKTRCIRHLIILILLASCTPFKRALTKTGNLNEAIQNALLDFSNTRRLHKKDVVFSVHHADTLFRMVLQKTNGGYEWVNGWIYQGIMAVTITGSSDNRLLLTANAKVGSKGELPSRFFEKNGKLYYWWDNDYPLTQEALAVYQKYNLLQDDLGGLITIADFVLDDAKKGAHYYFCRHDLTKYKRVITNKGIGYYDAPNVTCK
jgi:hypothetical protein